MRISLISIIIALFFGWFALSEPPLRNPVTESGGEILPSEADLGDSGSIFVDLIYLTINFFDDFAWLTVATISKIYEWLPNSLRFFLGMGFCISNIFFLAGAYTLLVARGFLRRATGP